jgi:hypothetical protein
MPCCLIRASHTLLIGHGYVLFEMAVYYLSIAQCAPILEREHQFIMYGSTIRLDRTEVRAEVECDLMKMSRILLS